MQPEVYHCISRSLEGLALAVVSPKSVSSSWTILPAQSSVTSRAPSARTISSLSSRASVKPGTSTLLLISATLISFTLQSSALKVTSGFFSYVSFSSHDCHCMQPHAIIIQKRPVLAVSKTRSLHFPAISHQRPSRWHSNETLIRNLRESAAEIASGDLLLIWDPAHISC